MIHIKLYFKKDFVGLPEFVVLLNSLTRIDLSRHLEPRRHLTVAHSQHKYTKSRAQVYIDYFL